MCSNKIERERILPFDRVYPRLFDEHLARYKLATRYVRGKRVLDLACGTGYGSHFMAVNDAAEVLGIDISKEAIDSCQSDYSANNLAFARMDSTRLALNDEYFDAVCAFEIIEHIEKANQCLRESKRVLKEGGLLMISTPNKSFFSPNSETPSNPYHVREYYFEEFQSLLQSHFEEIELWGQGTKRMNKLIPRGIQTLLSCIKSSTLLRQLILHKIESNYLLVGRNIFTKINIRKHSVFFLGICRKSSSLLSPELNRA
jgi:ubiquinone/menaquinone biosynthesis C-methylase UbiE